MANVPRKILWETWHNPCVAHGGKPLLVEQIDHRHHWVSAHPGVGTASGGSVLDGAAALLLLGLLSGNGNERLESLMGVGVGSFILFFPCGQKLRLDGCTFFPSRVRFCAVFSCPVTLKISVGSPYLSRVADFVGCLFRSVLGCVGVLPYRLHRLEHWHLHWPPVVRFSPPFSPDDGWLPFSSLVVVVKVPRVLCDQFF